MRRYEPIRPIDEESTARSMADADRLRARWDDLRAAIGEDRVRVAVDGERWRAAVETGVIERLYEVSRGVTEAIVRSGAAGRFHIAPGRRLVSERSHYDTISRARF